MSVIALLSQTITVGGQEIPAHDLQIEQDSRDVSRATFAAEVDAGSFTIEKGALVVINQSAGDDEFVFRGTVEEVNSRRGNNYTFFMVTALAEKGIARHYRFRDFWRAPTSASVIAEQAWTRHGPEGVSVAGVEPGAPVLEEYASEYDSLFDLMQVLADEAGWLWDLRDGVVYFAPPAEGAEIRQDAGDLERGSLGVRENLDMVRNVYRMQAWARRVLVGSETIESGCIGSISIPVPDAKWEQRGEAKITAPEWATDREVTVQQNGRVEFKPPIFVDGSGPPVTISARVPVRRLVWTERRNLASIQQYGRRDAPPIAEDGGNSVAAAMQIMDRQLRQRASPTVEIRCSLTRADVRPGDVCRFVFGDPILNRLLFVSSVRRTTTDGDLFVEINARSPEPDNGGGAEAVGGGGGAEIDPNPLPEVIRRLKRLETRAVHPDSRSGEFASSTGVIATAPQLGNGIKWSVTISAREAVTSVSLGHDFIVGGAG